MEPFKLSGRLFISVLLILCLYQHSIRMPLKREDPKKPVFAGSSQSSLNLGHGGDHIFGLSLQTVVSAVPGDPYASHAMAKFNQTYTEQELRILVEQVLEALPDVKGHVSQATYDNARAKAGFEHSPRAKYIAKRLGIPWPEVIARVRGSEGNTKGKSIDRLSTRSGTVLITDATVKYALGVIAKRLGTESFTDQQYEAERLKILAKATNEFDRRTVNEALPSADRLISVFNGWAPVCEIAGRELPGLDYSKRLVVGRDAYSLEDCKDAIRAGFKWAEEQGLRTFGTRDYQRFAAGREGIPSMTTLTKTLNAHGLGTFATFRDQLVVEDLKKKTGR